MPTAGGTMAASRPISALTTEEDGAAPTLWAAVDAPLNSRQDIGTQLTS